MSEKRILHLTLYRKWFDVIYKGEKTEEYRDDTLYWYTRLNAHQYDEVWFTNGYGKNRPFMRVEWKAHGIESKNGVMRHVIKLGKILEVRNYSPNQQGG